MDKAEYSEKEIRGTFGKPADHVSVHKTIVSFSRARADIRAVALGGLDLSDVRTVLDLGCGFGFFSMGLSGLIPRSARVLGVDMLEENRDPYLHNTAEAGLATEFLCAPSQAIEEFEPQTYDLISASYSLYFFPELVPAIARILRPMGIFVTLTHSRESLREIIDLIPECYRRLGVTIERDRIHIKRLLESFCAENGADLLAPHFGSVETIGWENSLEFPLDGMKHLYGYIINKKYLLLKELMDQKPQLEQNAVEMLFAMAHRISVERGGFRLNKNDAIFRCGRPR